MGIGVKETLCDLLGEMRDAAFLLDREGRVLFSNGRLPPGIESSEAERYDERVPESLRLPDPLPTTEALTERLAYTGPRHQRMTVRRRLVPHEVGLICVLSTEDAPQAATRLEILGRLVGYVSHDLNNMLTAVTGHTDLLLETIEEGRPEREWVEQIREAGRYAARLTQRLLAFGDVGRARPRELELNKQVGEFCKALVRLLSESATIEFVPAPQPVTAWFDVARLDQALLALAFGLHDNLLPGGTIRVRVDPRPALLIEAAPLRNERLDPSFDALTCVRGLFAETGAELQARGPGWFAIELPTNGSTPPVRGEGTVLVVDRPDEARVNCVKTLQDAGYRVLVAGTGEQALAAAREHRGLQVMLTAFGRRGINGPLLVQRFAKEFPDVRSLLLSGIADPLGNDSTAAFVPASYTPKQLLGAVARALQ